MYATGFRYYFTPLPGYFSPFPHGTHPLSVTKEYLGLADGPARFTRNSTSPVLLGKNIAMKWQTYAYGSITHYAQAFQPVQLHPPFITPRPVNSQATQHPTTPTPQHLSAITRYRFSLIHFRSPLLTESLLFSLPTGTKMFHFPAFPPTTLYIQTEVTGHNSGNSRFPHSDIPGSQLVYQLPWAYRRLQRPSSALGAKASTDRT